MIFGLVILAVLIGTLMPIQAGINAELTRFIKHPYMGALISFSVGSIALLIITLIQGVPLEQLKKLTTAPPHMYLGGFMGALFVASSIFLIPKMGATTMIAAFVTGQLLMSVAMDHFGVLGLQTNPITMQRLFGIVLLFIGLLLVLRKA